MKPIHIGVLVGSARKGAFSGSVAKALVGFFSEGFEPTVLPIDSLPLYNQDHDDLGPVPQEWTAFREKVQAMDGFLFVTPEYNRSIPPMLKNALDIASRPYGQNKWGGKPGAVVSVSPGAMGGFGANHHIRQCLTFLDVYTMQQPEAYIGNIAASVDESGQLTNASLQQFLQSFIGAYTQWVQRFIP